MLQFNNIENLKPFVKWVGGKSSSLDSLHALMPENIDTYIEPFVGSGALFFSSIFKKAIINDSNEELINAYKVIKDDVSELIMYLSTLIYDKNQYDVIRNWDLDENFLKRSKVERAARFIYLMKTCYNGLYRVNKKNHFNTPMGNYKDPNIVDVKTLSACSKYLQENEVEILNQDYSKIFNKITKGAFVYLDPPFYPESKTANFTNYQAKTFLGDEHKKLHDFFVSTHNKGAYVMLSNSDTQFIRDLYKDFVITPLEISRRVNSKTTSRKKVESIVITNYDPTTFNLVEI